MVHPQSVSAAYKEDNVPKFHKCGRENFQNGIQKQKDHYQSKYAMHPQSVSASYKDDNAPKFHKCGRENF